MTLREVVRVRDEALSGTGREIEALRATVHDKDKVLQAAEKAHSELRDQIVAGRPMLRVGFRPTLILTWVSFVSADLIL
jgi:hypothetical protein